MLCDTGEDNLAIEAALLGLSDMRLAAEGEEAIGTGRGVAILKLRIGNQKSLNKWGGYLFIDLSPGDSV